MQAKKISETEKEDELLAMVDFDRSSPLIWNSWKENVLRYIKCTELLRGAWHG